MAVGKEEIARFRDSVRYIADKGWLIPSASRGMAASELKFLSNSGKTSGAKGISVAKTATESLSIILSAAAIAATGPLNNGSSLI